jgi:ubiquinone/menaquinone biosynthesis C-methylase UbiE
MSACGGGADIAYARTWPGVSIADFRVADAQNLSLADNSFDVAARALVITFFPTQTRPLRR